jgi:RNA polymerase sigma-70 factor (ECF subfamily)
VGACQYLRHVLLASGWVYNRLPVGSLFPLALGFAMNDLPQRLACGEQSAFAELYDACADRLHGYLTLRTGSRHDADDLLQETFVRLSRQRAQLAGVDNLLAYVFTIARNESNRLLATRASAARKREPLPELSTPDEQAKRETWDEIRVALAQLNAELREVVELKLYGQLTLREIAEVTGLPQGTVATRYRAAVERLRSQMLRDVT